MSALTLAQSVCRRIGLPSPTTAVSSTDAQVLQVVELANEEGKELAKRPPYGWQALQNQATFTTTAVELQGTIEAIAPGMSKIINDTIWNRDLRRPIFGPLGPQNWQQLKALNMVGPWNQFRIRNGQLLFIPPPAVGQSCYFEYVTKYWCTSSDGLTGRAAFLQDTDVTLLDEELMVLGTIWRWKAAKGLEYAEDFNKYERQVIDAIASDAGKDVINMAGTRYDLFPGIVVPAGNWGI